ncbi:MAG: hypothetical protein H7Y39_08275 [Nitrospiraceae bacterium]|nr:hypothetical protein [Nitrospiraceae bacterium]
MVPISKIVGLMSCGLLLWLDLSHTTVNAAQASHPASPADPAERKGGQVGAHGAREKLKVGHRIEGEVLRVDGKEYFVMGKDGQEILLHSDPTTRKVGSISQGDRIVATVNDQNHMRSIRLADMADMSDRQNEQIDRAMEFAIETRKTGAMGQ